MGTILSMLRSRSCFACLVLGNSTIVLSKVVKLKCITNIVTMAKPAKKKYSTVEQSRTYFD